MIAGHGQNTVKPFAVQEPGFTLQAVAIEVLAGEMNDDFLAGLQDGFAQGLGRQLRIAAGVVGNRNPINGRAPGELSGKSGGLDRAPPDHRAAHGNHFGPDEKLGGLGQFFLQCLHLFTLMRN